MAVYTEVTDEALRAFLADYPLGGLRAFRGIAEGVENSQLRAEDRVGRLHPHALREAGGPARAALVPRPDGAPGGARHRLPAAGEGAGRRWRCATLAGRPAAICTFLPGVWPRRVRPEHCAPLGAALARLHLAGAGFRARSGRTAWGRPAWAPLLDRCRAGGDAVQPGLIAELDAALAGILAAWPAPGALPTGQIHADLFPDNVFFLDGPDGGPRVSGLIDFYFACTDLLAYDLAVCLNAWCFETDGSYNVTKAHALLAAYQRLRPLDGGGAGGAAGAVPRRGAPLPADPAVRLDDDAGRRDGDPQGPAGIPAQAALLRRMPKGPPPLASERDAAGRDLDRWRLQAESRPGRLGGDPEISAGWSASSPAPTRPPPTTAWS